MQLFVNSNSIFYIANIFLLLLAIFGSILVIRFKNPVYVVFSLILTFLATAICWIILNAEFLAFTLILLYVGAVMVLFLFVIMMLDLKPQYNDIKDLIDRKNHFLAKQLCKSLPIAIGLVAIFIYIAKDYSFLVTTSGADNNLYLLGQALFTDYMLLFCAAGLLLLASIVAVVYLSHTDKINRKLQSIDKQTVANKDDRLEMRDTI